MNFQRLHVQVQKMTAGEKIFERCLPNTSEKYKVEEMINLFFGKPF